MCGYAGAGKTTWRKKNLPDLYCVDPDEWRVNHPEYDPKDPGGEPYYHGKLQATMAFCREIGDFGSRSFVFDGAGSLKRYPSMVTMAHSCDYIVELIIVRTPEVVCRSRNKKRDRTLSDGAMQDTFNKVPKVIELLRTQVDNVKLVYGL